MPKCSRCPNETNRNHRYCTVCHAAYMREWRKTHRLSGEALERAKARTHVHVALKRGQLHKEPCWCGSSVVEAHHWHGYDNHLDVRWLCNKHHRESHGTQKGAFMDPTNIGEEVTVKKATLLERITRNRAGHRKEFHLALEGWHAEAVAELDRWKEDLSHGRRQSVFINRPIPEDHTRDYDLMIAMLEMHLGDEVTIPRREFSQMVMDDWHWKQEWKTSNASYVATGTKLSEAK